MALIQKNLGQQYPAAITEADLYTVPASTSTVCSSIVICNKGASATTVRVAHCVGGGATTDKDYLYFDLSIAEHDTFIATIGICMSATDKIKVYSASGSVSFNLYGQERT
jgi:hypothetical protein